MKRIATKIKKKVIKKETKKLIERKIMNDLDFQAGVTAAIQAYVSSLSGVYVVTDFSYTYTPPVTATPPAETVPVSL